MKRNDNSSDYRNWTTRKLLARLQETANLESFSGSGGFCKYPGTTVKGFPGDNGPMLRSQTRVYRQTWMQPLIEELAERLDIELPPLKGNDDEPSQ